MQDKETTSAVSTRNATFAELAAHAHEFLTAYAGMPDVASVDLADQPTTTGQIDCQVSGRDYRALAEWARALGVTVRLTDRISYVLATASTSVRGYTVRLWVHLPLQDVAALVSADELYDIRSGVDVDPARLLESTQDGA